MRSSGFLERNGPLPLRGLAVSVLFLKLKDYFVLSWIPSRYANSNTLHIFGVHERRGCCGGNEKSTTQSLIAEDVAPIEITHRKHQKRAFFELFTSLTSFSLKNLQGTPQSLLQNRRFWCGTTISFCVLPPVNPQLGKRPLSNLRTNHIAGFTRDLFLT